MDIKSYKTSTKPRKSIKKLVITRYGHNIAWHKVHTNCIKYQNLKSSELDVRQGDRPSINKFVHSTNKLLSG